MRRSIAIAIAATALCGAAPLMAYAAGLGKLTVFSALGAPLSAEIELVSLQPGEEDGLVARIAPPQAFQQAGIEFNPALLGVRFALERRGSARVLRVSSTQAVSEPFLDLLVELQWPTGRLVREYSVLLDPPGYKGPQPIAAVPPLTVQKPTPSPEPPPKPEAEEAPAATAAEIKAPPPPEAKPLEPAPAATPTPKPEAEPKAEEKPEAAEKAAPDASLSYEVQVQTGDTLGAIARQYLPPGVTLNQMLVAIYRANEAAFISENLNLVRAGRILNIPEAEAIGTVEVKEANRLVATHADEFNVYRTRLAAVPTVAEVGPGERAVAGQIEAKPPAPAPAAQDQVRLSKAEPQKPEASGARAARDDDLAARERALKEAQSRIADLEKNVADLQKLLELKNRQLAEMEKKAAAKPAPVPPIAAAPAQEAVKPAPTQAPKPAPAEAPKPAPEAAKPPTEAPKPKPKAAPAPPPPPSLLDEILDNQAALIGLAVIVLLLLGYALWSWQRRKKTRAKFQDSVFGAAAAATSAGTVSTTTATAQPGASEPAAGALEAEDVDPIAEADVYMAYGREAQAEEILKEALQKEPKRSALHSKLLEVYAKRGETRSFEQTAHKLQELTNGSGPEWEKAAALGRSLDPQNSLYGGSFSAAPAAAAAAVASVPAAAQAAAPSVDFDLGATSSGMLPDISLDEPKPADASALDLDLGGPEKGDFAPEGTFIRDSGARDQTGALDFDIGASTEHSAAPPAPEQAASSESSGLDFDLNLDLGGAEKKEAPSSAPDLSSISLDLGAVGESAAEGGTDPKWQEVATKLDLAKAYEEMGDKDGARELLNEVMQDGDAAQKGQAEQILEKLG